GTRAYMGRLFLPGEDQPGGAYVAVLSYEAWQTRFGADPNILGRHITLNAESYTVVGVLPRNYRLPFEMDVYITAQHQTSYRRDRATRPLLMVGRIKDNISLEQAQADLNTIAHTLARDYPNANAGIGVAVTEFLDIEQRSVRTPLLVLLGGVAVVLLIACANLSNLLLVRGTSRQRELAVRAALGARRARTVRQLISEAMLIAVLGGAAGVTLAYLTLPPLVRMAPSTFDISSLAVMDNRVLLFSLALTLLTGVFFGAAPAIQLSHINVAAALGAGTRGGVHSSAREKIRATFVVCQVAMSIVLLVAAGLLVRSFRALLATDTGMAINNLLTMEYRLPRNRYPKPEAQTAFHRELALRVAQVPGVVSSAIVRSLPFSGNWGQVRFILPNQSIPEKGKEPSAYENLVTPDYFQTAGIPLLRGRNFNDHDDASAPLVAIVSRAFAERYFPGQDPIGRTVQLVDSDPTVNGQRVSIIGVAGNAKQMSLRDTDEAELYSSYAQQPAIFGTLIVRTAVEPTNLAEPVRQAVWSLDKDQPVWKIRTLQFLVERDVESDRFLMILMAGFGALALLLSALGTYGVLSNAVNQRRQELGVRMALGAQPAAVRKLVIGHGMRLALIGGIVGLIAAAAGSRMLSAVLYGVSTLDVSAFVVGCAVMTGVAFIASYLPARRATRIDPARALRFE
ncbi:MAG TPA: ABC transporter permease, partial [Terriglobales bacterium]|nr:ABC transporter permease [Terriglobales bacterium]